MARAVVYDPPVVQEHYGAEVARIKAAADGRKRLSRSDRKGALKEAREKAGKNDPLGDGATSARDTTPRDDFLSKIAKYVPAEMITLTTLAFAAIEPSNDRWVLLIVGLGAVLNVIYLWSTVLADSKQTPPPGFFYVLSALAYCFWAIAVIGTVGEVFGVGGADIAIEQTFVLALAALAIPALDTVASHLAGPKP